MIADARINDGAVGLTVIDQQQLQREWPVQALETLEGEVSTQEMQVRVVQLSAGDWR